MRSCRRSRGTTSTRRWTRPGRPRPAGVPCSPQIYTAVLTTLLTGSPPRSDQDFLDDRSPFGLLQDIAAPTLFIQGTVDTLFSLQEAHENAIALIGNGVATKVV